MDDDVEMPPVNTRVVDVFKRYALFEKCIFADDAVRHVGCDHNTSSTGHISLLWMALEKCVSILSVKQRQAPVSRSAAVCWIEKGKWGK